MPVLNKLYLTFFCFLQLAFVVAQPDEIVFTRTTKENGLSATRIHSFIKDHQGYYWLSSINGLQRFDGNRMVSFRHDANDSASLPDNNVGCILEDNQKRLWINAGGYPCIYNPLRRNFRKMPVDFSWSKPLNIYSFFQDSKGTIWMLAGEDGLFVLDTIKNIFRPYTMVWPPFFSQVYYMAEDAETGRYWLIAGKGNVIIYDSKKKEYYHNGNNPEALQCFKNIEFSRSQALLYLDKNKILWTHGWIPDKGGFASFRYDIKKNELRFINNPGPQFWGFLTDRSGNTWAYGTVLGRYDEKLNQFVEVPKKRNNLYGIDFNTIYGMYEDPENNLWLMSDLGLYNFNLHYQYFTTINNVWSFVANKLVDASINGLIETRDGHIISIGWSGDGLVFFDSALNQVKPLYGFNPADYKNDMNYLLSWCGIQDHKGFIWIGCQQGRILQINPYTRKIVTLHPPEFEDITIRSMAEDKEGNIWFGAQRSILVKWERESNMFRQILSESKVEQPLDWMLSILPGEKGDIWVGCSSGGLLHIDIATGKIIEQFQHDENNPQSLSNDFIRAIVPLNNDTLAMATYREIDLFSINQKKFTHISENDGLPGGGIISLVADNRNNLWFTTVDGIAKVHLPDKRIHEYGPLDGVTENDFQFCAATCLRDGRIIFGNTRGYVYFNPAGINESAVPPDVVISGFRIFDKSLSVDSLLQRGNKIGLKHFENYITIQFALPGNMIYNRPVFYYKIEGIDKDWVATENPEAVYSYLPAGTYTFKVKCISKEGIPSAHITSFTIYIAPAFYQAWWFYILNAIFITGIIYYIYRQRLNKWLAVERLRTKVARDLHDDMGSTLSTINILSSMAKTKMTDDPQKTSEYISKISDNSQRMMEAMDDIVWSIKPANDSMKKITARMREFATGLMEAKDIELDFKVDEKVNDIKLNMEARRDLFLVFKEAVNNVAKYSHSSKCSIHVALHRHRLLLNVQDNGVGFDVNKADSGNGLSNMQKRAEALKGRVSVQSTPGKGTQVTLNMPVL